MGLYFWTDGQMINGVAEQTVGPHYSGGADYVRIDPLSTGPLTVEYLLTPYPLGRILDSTIVLVFNTYSPTSINFSVEHRADDASPWEACT